MAVPHHPTHAPPTFHSPVGQAIVSFQPEPFWVVRPLVSKAGQRPALEWGRGRVFDAEVGAMFRRLVQEARQVGAWVGQWVGGCVGGRAGGRAGGWCRGRVRWAGGCVGRWAVEHLEQCVCGCT